MTTSVPTYAFTTGTTIYSVDQNTGILKQQAFNIRTTQFQRYLQKHLQSTVITYFPWSH